MSLAWDPSRRRAWQVGFGRDHHAHPLEQACLPACVPATVDPRDEDMQDAVILNTTDATGAMLWSPSGLADFDAVPERVLVLWHEVRNGLAARGEPWSWWRVRGTPTSHWFAASPAGFPTEPARCGVDPDPDAEWLQEEGDHCRVCSVVVDGEKKPRAASGTIGGIAVGA